MSKHTAKGALEEVKVKAMRWRISDEKTARIATLETRLQESEQERARLAAALAESQAQRSKQAAENQKLRSAVKAAGEREAWLGEVLLQAEARMAEDGCDCGTDEPGSCALCLVQAALASPSTAAQTIGRVLRAVDSYVEASSSFERDATAEFGGLVSAHAALQALRSGPREDQPPGKEG